MGKSYKNLSRSQLIKLIRKLERQIVQEKINRKEVHKKPKVAYNLDNIFNDNVFSSDRYNRKMKNVKKMGEELDQQISQIDDKYQKFKLLQNPLNDNVSPSDRYNRKMKKVKEFGEELDQQISQIDDKYQKFKLLQNENVMDYPIIKTTLDDFRKEEIRLSKDKKRAKKSFIELFETRLNNMSDEKRIVSMTIDVRIFTRMEEVSKKGRDKYKKIPDDHKNDDDEYKMPYKKVLKQYIYLRNRNVSRLLQIPYKKILKRYIHERNIDIKNSDDVLNIPYEKVLTQYIYEKRKKDRDLLYYISET